VRKVFSLEGPPGDGKTSRLGSRDPVDGGIRCGPHGGEMRKTKSLSHPILQGKPSASHVCPRINLQTHDRQNECNTIAVTKRSRVKPIQYPLLHLERWTRRSKHNDN
jgi:hypothetical protein